MAEQALSVPRWRRLVPALLRDLPAFRTFFVGQSVSLVGDQVTLIALPLVAVLEIHADAAQMGYLATAQLIPNLLFSLHAGAWVDRRRNHRAAMLAADVGRALLIAAVPVAFWFGVLSLGLLYVVAFATGVLSVFFYVSYTKMFVALVPRERYVEGQGLLNGSRAFSFVLGPTLGGLLVQAISAPAALVVDACSFLVSAGSLQRLRGFDDLASDEEEGEKSVMTGLRWIRANAIVRAELAACATINLFNFVFFALYILFATRVLHVSPGVLGLLLGAAAVGGVIGALVTGRISRRFGIGPTFIAGCIVFPLPLVLVPLAGGPRWSVLAMLFVAEFGSGFGVMLLDITAGSINAAVVPGRLRARVSGAFMVVNYGVRPVGTMLGGLLGTAIGLRPTLWIATIASVLGVLFLVPSPIPRMRTLPEPAD
jgi:MFS family permease